MDEQGTVLFTGQDIRDGQNAWQSMGGQEVGTIWGHGAYLAPDWTADWLHREAVFLLNGMASEEGFADYENAPAETQAALRTRLQQQIRENTYDSETKTITITSTRYEAFQVLSQYYKGLFMGSEELEELRNYYSIPENAIQDPQRMEDMNAFFFWASWACVTERPGEDISYTHNWPSDELIGNKATGDLLLWTGFSVIMLLVGTGVLVFYHAKNKEDEVDAPKEDPLMQQNITPSMRAVEKYFWVVNLLILVQVIMGVITAHYGVEGNLLYGFPLAEILPYAASRTWHVQLAIYWIATAWLATGLYIGPSLTGKDPKFQKFGVNFLFVALLVIVVGSMAGQWMGIMQKLGYVENFWFGHQGYEYVGLGRFWQAFLLLGLFIWLTLMIRPMIPVFKSQTNEKHLLTMFLISCAAIALFFGAGLMWGRQTNLAIAEYWRWWVVHLWVEGFLRFLPRWLRLSFLPEWAFCKLNPQVRQSFLPRSFFWPVVFWELFIICISPALPRRSWL